MFASKGTPRWITVGLVLIAGLIVIGVWRASAATPVYTLKVSRRTVDRYVDERAVTSLPQRHVISMPYDGRIATILLREGDDVSAGQEVARLVDDEVELDVAQAQAALDRIQASLAENADMSLELTARKQAELYSDVTDANVKASEFQQEAASFWARYWEQAAERARNLAQQSAQTIEELQLAETNEAAKRAELAQQEVQVQSQRLMAQAVRLLPRMVLDYLDRKRLQGAVLERQLAEARLVLEERELRRRRAILTSPIDGVILKRETFSEQFLRSGTPLLEVGSLRDLEVEAEILSQEAGGIRPGNQVEIYGPGLGRELGAGLDGVVRRVHPDAFTKISSLGVEQQRVRVDIALDKASLAQCHRMGIGIGYRVRVRIVTERRENALATPRSSLFRNEAGGWSLFVVRQGRAEEQPVRVGIMNDDWSEILEGLEENEQVVLAPDSDLISGTRVRPLPAVLPQTRPSPDE